MIIGLHQKRWISYILESLDFKAYIFISGDQRAVNAFSIPGRFQHQTEFCFNPRPVICLKNKKVTSYARKFFLLTYSSILFHIIILFYRLYFNLSNTALVL